jgi:hypothetical protein
MERVGHHDAVEVGERQRAGEVGDHDIQLRRREPLPHHVSKRA